MEKKIVISARDYRAIAGWEDDGGNSVEVLYEVIAELSANFDPNLPRLPDDRRDVIDATDVNQIPRLAA